MNPILLQRICKLIAINYAVSEEVVLKIFQETGSIDKILVIMGDTSNEPKF